MSSRSYFTDSPLEISWERTGSFRNIERHRRLSVNSSLSMSQNPRGDLSVDEVQVAEREIFRHLHKLSFPDVVVALQRVTRSQESSRQVKPRLRKLKMTTSLCKLNPVLDGEGILRVGGRLENAAMSLLLWCQASDNSALSSWRYKRDNSKVS